MPERASKVIGYVVDVQANVLTASLIEDDQGRTPTVTIGVVPLPRSKRRARDRLEGRLLLEPVLRDGRARAEERHPPSRE